MPREEALEWIASWPARWAAETGADWAVVDAGDAVLGRIGLRRLDLHDGVGEAAYWVLPHARGRGVAVLALDALARWAFAAGLHRLELVHSTANAASCRAALKAGFAPEGTLRGQALHEDGRHDMHLHARLAGDRP
jgi:RimJ/RimL family protein N-acetyltransferase